jgi:hypothetical protein
MPVELWLWRSKGMAVAGLPVSLRPFSSLHFF